MQGDFFLTQGVFYFMRWLFESVTGQSIVLTVVISTVLIRALTLIGDIKSRQSTIKMQAIQPQLNKLQKKYQNDPQRFQREQSKLMKENNVSMFGGCLPMLFTLPLFFVFIAAFRQWGEEMQIKVLYEMAAGNTEAGLTLFKSFRFGWIYNMWQADSGMASIVPDATTLFSGTSVHRLFYFAEHPEAAELFVQKGFFVVDASSKYGYAVAEITDAFKETYNTLMQPCADLYAGHNNGWFVLPLLCCGSQVLATWVMQKGQPKSDDNNSAAGTSKVMMWIMPLITLFYCLRTNSAFAMYWTVSSLLSMVTTMAINKIMGVGKPAGSADNKPVAAQQQ